ncbi:hypothetical protein ACO2Q1_10230 [Brevundimonas sp. VNH65]|uniref:hypothetical protein n=1 Tax=Brevundimonas sp. VNH65 TaxID=3400917 RepID=UPI003BFDD72F
MLRTVARDIVINATTAHAEALASLADAYFEIGPNGAEIPARHHDAFDRQAVGCLVDAELSRAGIRAAGNLVAAFRTLSRRPDDLADAKRQMAAIILGRSAVHSQTVALAAAPVEGSA